MSNPRGRHDRIHEWSVHLWRYHWRWPTALLAANVTFWLAIQVPEGVDTMADVLVASLTLGLTLVVSILLGHELLKGWIVWRTARCLAAGRLWPVLGRHTARGPERFDSMLVGDVVPLRFKLLSAMLPPVPCLLLAGLGLGRLNIDLVLGAVALLAFGFFLALHMWIGPRRETRIDWIYERMLALIAREHDRAGKEST